MSTAAMVEPKEIGERIQLVRELKGWTQERLALEMHLSVSTIRRWEQGRGEPAPTNQLLRLAVLLEVDPSEFIEFPKRRDTISQIRLDLSELLKIAHENQEARSSFRSDWEAFRDELHEQLKSQTALLALLTEMGDNLRAAVAEISAVAEPPARARPKQVRQPRSQKRA